jgi:methyl-accepting chemotaxis protein
MRKRSRYLVKSVFQIKYTAAMVAMVLAVMLTTGIGMYVGMWSSIIENFSEFKVSENLETAKRIAAYEETRYKKGDVRLENIFRQAELLSAKEQETLRNALKTVNRALMPKIAALLVAIFAAGIFISHRIAGPMYRLERSADALSHGDLSVNFNIRKSDEMHEMAESLEGMVESLRKDMRDINALADAGNVKGIKAVIAKYKL